ncbi:MAG: hypothetical protein INR62_11835, partial [Rhodospirillales bacterium]|nr:hypothetical protein [Acetobacter sp.]
TTLLVSSNPERLYAAVQAGLWVSMDGGRLWTRQGMDATAPPIESLALDSTNPAVVWGVASGRLFSSADKGATWKQSGQALPAQDIVVNGLTITGATVILSTNKGIYRTMDAGSTWTLLTENLPAHMEAGPVLGTTDDPDTFYAGFSLVPYRELWRRAASPETVPLRNSLLDLMKGAAILLALSASTVVMLRRLAQYYRPSNRGTLQAKVKAVHPSESKRLP